MARRGAAQALAVSLLLSLSSFAAALYGSGPVIHDLTDASYKSKLKGLALVELYAPCASGAAAGQQLRRSRRNRNARVSFRNARPCSRGHAQGVATASRLCPSSPRWLRRWTT